MSVAAAAQAPALAHEEHAHDTGSYLDHQKGWRSWLYTLDHKRISLLYLGGVSFSLLLGGLFALAVRLELWSPGNDLVSNDTYNKLFTLHGAVMVFLFIIPGIPAALGNFVLPLQLGAKDVAFPRLNLLSFYLYALGAVLFLAVLVGGGVDTGWTLYPPYSFEDSRGLSILLAWSVPLAALL